MLQNKRQLFEINILELPMISKFDYKILFYYCELKLNIEKQPVIQTKNLYIHVSDVKGNDILLLYYIMTV